MSACFDTSVLVSLYMRDANWQEAVSLVSAHKGAVWTPWQRLEFNNAVRAHVARGNIDIAAVRKIEETIRLSIENRDMIPRPLPAYAFWQEADRLSRAHTHTLGVRTLDLLHVAAACVLKATRFCTFDNRQHALARAAGLSIN